MPLAHVTRTCDSCHQDAEHVLVPNGDGSHDAECSNCLCVHRIPASS